jgi:hypothetical protein
VINIKKFLFSKNISITNTKQPYKDCEKIKIIDIKIKKINPLATDLFLKFEDDNVDQDQYTFLKDKIDNFKYYINHEYSMESEIIYNEVSEILIIGITTIIPDQFMPKDFEKCAEIIMNKINLFRNFYEAQNQLYKGQSKIQ